MKTKLGWEFLPEGTMDGDIQTEYGPPVLGRSTLEACPRLLQTLKYGGESLLLGKVKLSERVVVGEQRMAASRREVMWVLPLEKLLTEFALRVSEEALSLVKEESPVSFKVIELHRKWMKEPGNVTLESEILALRTGVMLLADEYAKEDPYHIKSLANGATAWAVKGNFTTLKSDVWSCIWCASLIHPDGSRPLVPRSEDDPLWWENWSRLDKKLMGMIIAERRKGGLPKTN